MSTGWFSSSSRPYPKIFSVCELMSTMRPWSSTPTMASGADSSRSPNQRSAVAPRSTPGVASDGRSRVPARAAGGGSEALRARGFELRGVRPMPPPPPSRGSSYYAFRPIAWSEVSGTARVLHRPRKCAVPAFTGLASGLAFQAWLGPAVYACASMRGDCPLLGSGNCTRRAPRTRRSAAEHPREQPRRDVARLRIRVGRHRPVFDEQLPEAAHDDGEAEGREHLVVVEVPDAAVDELLVARDRLLPPRKAREALEPVPPERRARGRRDPRHPPRRVVRRVVGRDAPLDPSHHEEAGPEHVRAVLEPEHGRHRHVRRLAEPLHDVELLADVVRGKDGEAARLDAHHHPRAARAAVLGPLEVEEERVVREAGRGGLGHARDGEVPRLRHPAGEPGGELPARRLGVARLGKRHREELESGRRSHPGQRAVKATELLRPGRRTCSPTPDRGALRPPQLRASARRQHRGDGPPAAAPHLLEQILDLERLLDAAGGADAPSPLLRARVRGHDHDRDRRQGRIAQLLRPGLLPVHPRHHEVEQDERGRRHGMQPLERLLAGRGADDSMALVLEDRDERIAQIEVVLDDEDGRGDAIIRLIGHDAIVDQIESFRKPDGCQNFEPLAPAREHPWGSRLGLALAWEPGACRSSRAAIWTPPSPSNPPMPTARASATGRSAPGSSSASTTATARRRAPRPTGCSW